MLYSFHSTGDGCEPYGGVILDASGNIYGTTYTGGGYAGGIAFELSLVKGQWVERLLYAFHGPQGSSPVAGLVFDSAGNLYGTTLAGGGGGCTYGCGVVFKLAPTTRGQWKETVLHVFAVGGDGIWPYASVVFDSSGNLYGTTYGGGAYAAGTVYELKPSGGNWNESILHSFQPNGIDGISPTASLVLDSSGNLYGTTVSGGALLGGVAFKLSPGSNGWPEKILHNFGKTGDGAAPYAGLVLTPLGRLRGTTSSGGANNVGSLFTLANNGNGQWQEWLSYSFTDNGVDGYGPYLGNLFLAADGNLYGTTPYGGSNCGATGCGTVFQLAP